MANKWESGEIVISYIVFRKSLSNKVACELATWKKQGRELCGYLEELYCRQKEQQIWKSKDRVEEQVWCAQGTKRN